MSVPIKHQVIEQGGQPIFVLVPYEEYLEMVEQPLQAANIPLEVAEIALLDDKSLMRAWREHLGLTQEEVAIRAGISRGAYAQMESKDARPRLATLRKIAAAMGIQASQLREP